MILEIVSIDALQRSGTIDICDIVLCDVLCDVPDEKWELFTSTFKYLVVTIALNIFYLLPLKRMMINIFVSFLFLLQLGGKNQ